MEQTTSRVLPARRRSCFFPVIYRESASPYALCPGLIFLTARAKANSGAQPMKNFSPWQQLSIAFAILAILFYFALQIPWVAALFG
jgi:hypothetical protein